MTYSIRQSRIRKPQRHNKAFWCAIIFMLILQSMFGAIDAADATTPTDSTISVGGDDDLDGYQGTGGLLLPSSYSGPASKRTTVAQCIGCYWRYTIYCDQSSNTLCAHAVTTCPSGSIRYRVWFGRNAQALQVIGSVCWGGSNPPTRRNMETSVRTSALRLVPTQKPGINPRSTTLTSVPIIVWSGQAAVFQPKQMLLAGHRVNIRANAYWLWQWGDGSSQWVRMSGRRFPARDITHQYRKPGRYTIKVTTVWQANYQVQGIGNFPMSGDIVRQQKTMQILVKSSRSILVAGDSR